LDIGGFCKKYRNRSIFVFSCPHFGAYGYCISPPGSAQPLLTKGTPADMQKPYAPKFGQEKTKIDLFRDFLQKSPMSKL
jgi:hypothetical protein